MRKYISFLEINGQYEMSEIKSDSKEKAYKVLKENGYKIYGVVSKHVFENYRNKPPAEFIRKFFMSRTDEFRRFVLNSMFK